MAVKRRAMLAAVAGAESSAEAHAAVTVVARLLARQLSPDQRVDGARARAAVDAGALREELKAWAAEGRLAAAWLVLAGEAFEDEPGEWSLRTSDRQGLDATKLARWFARVDADVRVMVLDVPEAAAVALRKLDFGPCALFAAGPGCAERLATALLGPPRGPRTAGQAAAALGGRSDAPDLVLNVVSAEEKRPDPHAMATLAYLRAVATEADKVPLDDATRDEGSERTLSSVYEPALTRGDEQGARRPGAGRKARDLDEKETLGGPEARGPSAHERFAEHRCLFLVGDPGSGKTTFLKRLAGDLALATLGEGAPVAGADSEAFPIRCDLTEVRGEPSPEALLEAAFSCLACEGTSRLLDRTVAEAALESGRVALLFDGLDEVPGDDRRRKVALALTKLADAQAKKARLVVACRPAAANAGAQPGRPFRRADLQPFDDAQIARVAANWLRARADMADRAEAVAAQLVADLRLNDAVHLLASNPLTLAMVCVVLYRDRDARLPRDRTELYERLITLLLIDRERGVGAAPLEPWERRAALTDLADVWWARVNAAGADATSSAEDRPRDPRLRGMASAGGDDAALVESQCVQVLLGEDGPDLTPASGQPFDARRRKLTREEAQRLVRFLDERAGLLVWRAVERGQRALRFAHRTFAEYLVACRLTEHAQQRKLADRALDAGWREVALMYVAELARMKTSDREPAWSFVRGLMARAESADTPWSTRSASARLAAECLADWRERAPPGDVVRLDRLQDDFVDADKAAQMPVEERAAFWVAVGEHNRLVLETGRWAHVPEGTSWRGAAPGDELAFGDESPAGPVTVSEFLIARWPVTVSEWAAFWEAGGYREDAFWSADGREWRGAEGIDRPADWPLPGRPNHPVTGISFWEAEAWCRWTTASGRAPREGWVVRLPTEAEWERAARGDYTPVEPVARYPWGWDDDPRRRLGDDTGILGALPPGVFPGGVGATARWKSTAPVSTPTTRAIAAVANGLWDLSGNVWEWCLDAYGSEHVAGFGKDPVALPPQGGEARVLRGGAFWSYPRRLRVSCRYGRHPSVRHDDFGFRCVAVPRARALAP